MSAGTMRRGARRAPDAPCGACGGRYDAHDIETEPPRRDGCPGFRREGMGAAPEVWVVLDGGVVVGVAVGDPHLNGWRGCDGREFRRYVPNGGVLLNGLATDEQLELDRYLREQLCIRPASGPDAQSIDDGALELLSVIVEGAADEGRLHAPERARAAIALFDTREPDPWARCRKAAAILRGET